MSQPSVPQLEALVNLANAAQLTAAALGGRAVDVAQPLAIRMPPISRHFTPEESEHYRHTDVEVDVAYYNAGPQLTIVRDLHISQDGSVLWISEHPDLDLAWQLAEVRRDAVRAYVAYKASGNVNVPANQERLANYVEEIILGGHYPFGGPSVPRIPAAASLTA